MFLPLTRAAARLAAAITLSLAVALLLPTAARADWPASGIEVLNSYNLMRECLVLPDSSGGVYACQRQTAAGHSYPWYVLDHLAADGSAFPTGYTPGSTSFDWDYDGFPRDHAFFPLRPLAIDGAASIWWSTYTNYPLTGAYYDSVYVNRWASRANLTWFSSSRATGVAMLGLEYLGSPSMVAPDGFAGAYMAWVGDYAYGPSKWPYLRLQHLQESLDRQVGWPDTGIVLSTNLGTPSYVSQVGPLQADPAGGAYVSWVEGNLRVKHITAAGGTSPGWPATGLALSATFSHDYNVRLGPFLPSDVNSIIASWYDSTDPSGHAYRLQRFTPAGTLAPGWPAGGVLVTAVGDSFPAFQLTSDGQGGAYVAWQRGTMPFATRVLADGSFAPGWPAGGCALLDAAGVTTSAGQPYRIVAGAGGGLVVAWDDARHGAVQVRVRWFLGDGTRDPATPDTGLVIAPGDTRTVKLSGIASDGVGGLFLTRTTSEPTGGGSYPLIYRSWMHRVVYPALVSVPVHGPRPAALALAAAGRNPSGDAVEVRCTLPRDGVASVALYDLNGRRLRESSVSGAGAHLARFGDLGALPPGVYLVRLVQGGESRAVRVTLLR